MVLNRSDCDQATRYPRYACELLERHTFGKTVVPREVLELAARRLSPGDNYIGDAAAEITVLRDIAGKLTGEACTDILKAVAILTDRSG